VVNIRLSYEPLYGKLLGVALHSRIGVFNVEEPHPGHLYWPDIDVDLSLEIIEHPERFPLQSNLKSCP
jgi:hypothetical protein